AATTTRKRARKPPVIDRLGINAMDVPTTEAPELPPDPASTYGADPGATPAPAGTSGQASGATPSAPSGSDGFDFPVNAPPQVTVPPVPAGFIPVNAIDLRGFRPMQSELASVPDAILELNNFQNYTLLFGITAPPASQVSARLTVAAAWTALFS